MTQEALDQLVQDGAKLFTHNDMYELAQFLGYLAEEYKLNFTSLDLGLDDFVEIEQEVKILKNFDIMVSYEEQGVVSIKAETVEEAEKLVYDAMENDGLTGLDFDVSGREYLTHGERKRY